MINNFEFRSFAPDREMFHCTPSDERWVSPRKIYVHKSDIDSPESTYGILPQLSRQGRVEPFRRHNF